MRVGIIGTGHMGGTHAKALTAMPNIEIYFLARRQESDAIFARNFTAQPVDSLEALISKVDVVDICTPTDTHLDYTKSSLAAGRAVFLEKPIALTLEDSVDIMKTADDTKVPLMIGQVVRYFPEYAAGRQMVKEGKIGTPAAARCRRGGRAPSGWFMDHARSGGILLDLAIHDFDWLRWTLGEVKSLYSRSVQARHGEGPDYGLTTLTFESGAIAHVESTWMDPSGFRTTFEVAGSAGLIQHDSRETSSLRTHTIGGSAAEMNLSITDDPYYKQLAGFFHAVDTGGPVPVTAYEGAMALSISLAAIDSAQTGRAVTPVRLG